MLLAGDGQQVIVLERDPAAPPAEPIDAWNQWQRPGVNQFRLPLPAHLAGYRVRTAHSRRGVCTGLASRKDSPAGIRLARPAAAGPGPRAASCARSRAVNRAQTRRTDGPGGG